MTEAMNPLCDACGGSCCSFRTMGVSFAEIPEGRTLQEVLDGRVPEQVLRPDGKAPRMTFYDAHEKETGERHLIFECAHVSPQGKCRIYENRPEMCRIFECDALKGTMKLGPMLRRFHPVDWRRKRDVTAQVFATARARRRLEV